MKCRRSPRIAPAVWLLPAVLILLAIAAVPGGVSAAEDPQGPEWTTLPPSTDAAAPITSPPAFFEKAAPVYVGASFADATPADRVPISSLRILDSSAAEHRAELANELILRKYLHFRVSLSTP